MRGGERGGGSAGVGGKHGGQRWGGCCSGTTSGGTLHRNGTSAGDRVAAQVRTRSINAHRQVVCGNCKGEMLLVLTQC